jgi:hypothetical protein
MLSNITIMCNLNKVVYLCTFTYIGCTKHCSIYCTVRTNLYIIFNDSIPILVNFNMFTSSGMCKTVAVTGRLTDIRRLGTR